MARSMSTPPVVKKRHAITAISIKKAMSRNVV